MGEVDEVQVWRVRVAEAHERVIAGAYDAALATFAMALPALRARLGETDPEVVELAEDLETLRAMRDVAGLVEELAERRTIHEPGGAVRTEGGDGT